MQHILLAAEARQDCPTPDAPEATESKFSLGPNLSVWMHFTWSSRCVFTALAQYVKLGELTLYMVVDTRSISVIRTHGNLDVS
jgi:hypothetical protein